MSQGKSGRIVIDIDPQTKAEIYRNLTARGLTMREWFLDMTVREALHSSDTQCALEEPSVDN